jgi:hypothetical protein
LALNMCNELGVTMTTIKTYCLFVLMFSNISYIISSSLKDEKLQLSSIQLKPWVEDKPMTSKWNNSFSNEKWKRKVSELDAPTYIIHAHQTKFMGFKQRLWFTLCIRLKTMILDHIFGFVVRNGDENEGFGLWFWTKILVVSIYT